jgi:hypothetical protein
VDSAVTVQKIAELESEELSRPVRTSPIETIDLPQTEPSQYLTFPGTVSVLVTRKGTGVLDEFRAAVGQGKDAVDAQIARLVAPGRDRPRLSLGEAADAVAQLPVIADIRDGARPLAQHIALPEDVPAAMLAFAYNGGEVAPGGLQLVEYHRDDSGDGLEALALVHAPPLSDVQRAMVERDGPGTDPCPAVTGVVGFVLFTMAMAMCGMDPGQAARWRELDASAWEAAVPEGASARDLLAARRRILRDTMKAAGAPY